MAIPESALLLAGFTLAHAAWSISGGPASLVPHAVVERNGRREIMRFDAERQEEAIAHGKARIAWLDADVHQFAFARKALLQEGTGAVEVIHIDVGTKGSRDRVVSIFQRFEPHGNRRQFRLLGDVELAIDGQSLDSADIRELVSIIRRGIAEHPKAASLWDDWQQAGDSAPLP